MSASSTRNRRIRRGAAGAVLVAGALTPLLTACNGIQDVSLPGGNATGGHVYHVKVEFRDVLDLVPQAAVRVDDVPVGDVEKVQLDGFHAVVTVRVKDSVKLPKNAHAELRSTSLLGEKFVALEQPPAGIKPVGRLSNNDVIPLAATGRNPEFEEVFTALSALLNGGGVAQIQTISVELSNALAGRESQVRDVLTQLTTLVGSLDDSKAQIVKALDSVDRLAKRLAAQKGTIAQALDDIPSALAVLADQRHDLTRVLTSLSKLGGIGTSVIRATRENTVASLRSLQPVLDNLVSAKANIVNSLELLLNFPFPASSTNAIHGDYAGLYATVDLNLTDVIAGLTGPTAPTTQCPAGSTPVPLAGCLPVATGGTSPLPSLPTLPLPKAVPSLPLPGSAGGGSSGSGQGGASGPSGGLLGTILGTSSSSDTRSDYTLLLLQGAAA
jgi:phospholipid/cholesterol/gamma-HCH transport system substrate-binding protein